MKSRPNPSCHYCEGDGARIPCARCWPESDLQATGRFAGTAPGDDNLRRSRAFFRCYEAFDPNGRGQAAFPTRTQLAALEQDLAAQFAAIRASAIEECAAKLEAHDKTMALTHMEVLHLRWAAGVLRGLK